MQLNNGKTVWASGQDKMAINSSNDRLISDLPLHIFDKLVSRARASAVASPIDASAQTLRQQMLFKLQANNADGGGSITTVREIIMISPPTLVRILDPCLTHVECNRLFSRIHRECAVHALSAMEMVHRTNNQNNTTSRLTGKISTGLPTLDAHLHGGIPIGSVVEIIGRAGVGKTHFAQQLCALAANSDGGAVYIDTEKKLSLVRLRELAFERFLSDQNHVGYEQPHANEVARELAQQVLENVTVHSLLTTRELLDTLDQLENEIIHRNSEAAEWKKGTATNASKRRLPVRLIVVDSIAAPLRRDFDMVGSLSSRHRASAIFQIAKRLKRLAHEYQLAVAVVNQVGSGNIQSRTNFQHNNFLGDGEYTASLGTVWQYCVSTRILLDHEEDPHRLHQGHQSTGSSVRMATLAKSLVSKRTKLPFDLTKQGLCEVSAA